MRVRRGKQGIGLFDERASSLQVCIDLPPSATERAARVPKNRCGRSDGCGFAADCGVEVGEDGAAKGCSAWIQSRLRKGDVGLVCGRQSRCCGIEPVELIVEFWLVRGRGEHSRNVPHDANGGSLREFGRLESLCGDRESTAYIVDKCFFLRDSRSKIASVTLLQLRWNEG